MSPLYVQLATVLLEKKVHAGENDQIVYLMYQIFGYRMWPCQGSFFLNLEDVCNLSIGAMWNFDTGTGLL
jgi:hypothetical protein